MSTTRREFLGRAATTALLGTVPLSLDAPSLAPLDDGEAAPARQGQQYDTSWPDRVTGKHRAVFDVPELENGAGVFRASIWLDQYERFMRAAPRDLSAVLVIRHEAIALAMTQEYWDRYGVGKLRGVRNPATDQPTDRNPILPAPAGAPASRFDGYLLPRFMERGGIVVACDLAMRRCVELVRTTDGATPEAARAKALAMLIPGVILQPSGIFAVVRAQEAGCHFVRASS